MDLDFLLKWVTGRNLAALGALAAAVWLFDAFQEYPRAAYERWRFPPQRPDARQGADILKALEEQESLRLRVLHRKVSADIARAEAAGRRVAGLQRLADAALSLDAPGYRKTAMEKLNEVRLKIPRGEGARAVSPEDETEAIPPDARGRAARRRR
ncbi:MAG: hypothetical protein SF051_00555 [Elusimicrobiota bacterium]|nr:hypothetical protein [Elusimicrobiota bacterium]